jgi:circadian clock protein KaiB
MEINKNRGGSQLVLKLFVSGASPNSVRAISNIQKILQDNFSGEYSLSIIDVYQEKAVAEREQIIALPLLIRKSPLPERRLIGDMSDTRKVIEGLGIFTNTSHGDYKT